MTQTSDKVLRYDWTDREIRELLTGPLMLLLEKARKIHQEYADPDIEKCELLSIKTGGCQEDCGYCAQSAHHDSGVGIEPLLSLTEIRHKALQAKERGASRFCMGAAWKNIPTNEQFLKILGMIEMVSSLGLEVCCTLGMATEDQLKQMKKAGLTAYNHNLDTSREYYPQVVKTRTYDERIQTLMAARRAGVKLCCGGILGLGEGTDDRVSLLKELSSFNPHPESVPINMLVPVEGTPLAGVSQVPFEQLLRMIATARILMPRSRVRLSAGRHLLSKEEQECCFKAGANSIFIGEKLLTTPNV